MPHQLYPDKPSSTRCHHLGLTKKNPKMEDLMHSYHTRYKLSRLHSMTDRAGIDIKIRDFMKLNEIEDFSYPSLDESYMSFETAEETFKSVLGDLYQLRSDVVRISLMGTRGAYGRRIAEIVEWFKGLHTALTKFVHKAYEADIEEVQFQKKLQRQRTAAKRKSIASRLKKMKLAFTPDSNGVFEALAKERDHRLAQLEKAMDLMQKHCVLINLAQDNMAWDSERFFCRGGAKQGKLWTHGFKAEHFTKLANGIWSVQMKWTAIEKSEWRPGTVYVDRRFGRYDKTKVDWVKMEPARIVSGPGDVEFVVDIRVRDEFFFEEQERGGFVEGAWRA
ncbi:hypothetical protein V8C37DRAFT_35617 [Trichoderma ceciliae]